MEYISFTKMGRSRVIWKERYTSFIIILKIERLYIISTGGFKVRSITVNISFDDDLLKKIDQVAREKSRSRS